MQFGPGKYPGPIQALRRARSAATAHAQRNGRCPAHTDGVRCCRTQIDHQPAHKRPAIVDPHDYRTAIVVIEDGDVSAEWQRAVRRRHSPGVHLLTACCATAAVDRGDARIAERSSNADRSAEISA